MLSPEFEKWRIKDLSSFDIFRPSIGGGVSICLLRSIKISLEKDRVRSVGKKDRVELKFEVNRFNCPRNANPLDAYSKYKKRVLSFPFLFFFSLFPVFRSTLASGTTFKKKKKNVLYIFSYRSDLSLITRDRVDPSSGRSRILHRKVEKISNNGSLPEISCRGQEYYFEKEEATPRREIRGIFTLTLTLTPRPGE